MRIALHFGRSKQLERILCSYIRQNDALSCLHQYEGEISEVEVGQRCDIEAPSIINDLVL